MMLLSDGTLETSLDLWVAHACFLESLFVSLYSAIFLGECR